MASAPSRPKEAGWCLPPPVAHHLGLADQVLGDHDATDAWFAEAVELAERCASPLFLAYTGAAWARLLADRDRDDDRTRARTMAEAALTTAEAGAHGYIRADSATVLERLDPTTT